MSNYKKWLFTVIENGQKKQGPRGHLLLQTNKLNIRYCFYSLLERMTLPVPSKVIR
ncbi:MAG: hypothetical protein JWO58_13 [Chitinophagaceae bacterium]|nr:hypothetical protein [Chitinophagaceae bacterium]